MWPMNAVLASVMANCAHKRGDSERKDGLQGIVDTEWILAPDQLACACKAEPQKLTAIIKTNRHLDAFALGWRFVCKISLSQTRRASNGYGKGG